MPYVQNANDLGNPLGGGGLLHLIQIAQEHHNNAHSSVCLLGQWIYSLATYCRKLDYMGDRKVSKDIREKVSQMVSIKSSFLK